MAAYVVAIVLVSLAAGALSATRGFGDVKAAEGKAGVLLNTHAPYAKHCRDLKEMGFEESGNYIVYPESGEAGTRVFCDMSLFNGGWTVIQRRIDNTSFDKTYKEYEDGFGDHEGSFWLGLRNIRRIVCSELSFELYVAMTLKTDVSNQEKVWCTLYQHFRIDDSRLNYALSISNMSAYYRSAMCDNNADVPGAASYAMMRHNGRMFSARTIDNDGNDDKNCADELNGGWWYGGDNCWDTNLNGRYYDDPYGPVDNPVGEDPSGIGWYQGWGKSEDKSRELSALRTLMAVRPTTQSLPATRTSHARKNPRRWQY